MKEICKGIIIQKKIFFVQKRKLIFCSTELIFGLTLVNQFRKK